MINLKVKNKRKKILNILYLCGKYNNIKKVAKISNTTPEEIIKNINNLEEILNTKLVIISKDKIILTNSGKNLFAKLHNMI